MSLVTPDARPLAPVRGLATLAVRSACWVAFWLAIALPGVYLPLLAMGHTDAGMLGVGLHTVTVLLGQGHR